MAGDKRIELKDQEKIDNYSELRREMKKIWNLSQVVVVLVEIGAESEPKLRGYRNIILSLWLNKGMFWVVEQRPGKYYSQE